MSSPSPDAIRSGTPFAPTVLQTLRNPRALSVEVLAGIVTTLALIPEVISFSVIAGVDPKVSLVASVVLAI